MSKIFYKIRTWFLSKRFSKLLDIHEKIENLVENKPNRSDGLLLFDALLAEKKLKEWETMWFSLQDDKNKILAGFYDFIPLGKTRVKCERRGEYFVTKTRHYVKFLVLEHVTENREFKIYG